MVTQVEKYGFKQKKKKYSFKMGKYHLSFILQVFIRLL